jgi:hypothetical protein
MILTVLLLSRQNLPWWDMSRQRPTDGLLTVGVMGGGVRVKHVEPGDLSFRSVRSIESLKDHSPRKQEDCASLRRK